MAKARDQPVFIVHKHVGSRLQYDLHLELGDTVKSWVIPRGISMDPRVRRLASEGKPAEEKSMLWDKGTLEFSGGEEAFIKGLERGRMTFVLRGKKLHGAFSMFRFVGKRQWLLVKRQDKYATSEEVMHKVGQH